MKEIELNNGRKMPMLGLGVFKTLDEKEMDQAIVWALQSGYRSFDTAQMYGNEEMLGEALLKSGAKREDIFLTSKVNTMNMGYEKTKTSFQESLEKLQTDYLDLFLVHWPGQQKKRLQETWKAMEELVKEGKVRSIGVCNCTIRHLEWILESATIVPVVNQVERTPLLNQKELADWCWKHQIQMEAWAPLIRGNMNQPEIVALAKKYNKTPAQIILRWDVQTDFIVIPKSVHQNRIEENADIFDFTLEEEDVAVLNGMDQGHTSSFDVETYDF